MDVFKKIIKVPKERDITIHVPENIPVNTPVEVRLSIPKEFKPASIKIIYLPIDTFLAGEETDSVEELTMFARTTLDSE
jgi:hypothetical protein